MDYNTCELCNGKKYVIVTGLVDEPKQFPCNCVTDKKYKDGMHFYCPENGCNGLLLESPMVILMHPCIHKYQCLSCNKRYLRNDDECTISLDSNQKRDMYFQDFKIKNIEWELK
jgi:hypothetical protein